MSQCLLDLDTDGFEVGNAYLRTFEFKRKKHKIYYMAVNKRTLVTYREGKFTKHTSAKEGHSSIAISVADLCFKWNIEIKEFDDYMQTYFQPSEEARIAAREKQDR